MKILIFSDLHGLIENVEKYISNGEFSKYLFAGDFLGYFIATDKIIKLFNKIDIEYIIGNHDLYFLRKLFEEDFEKYYSEYNDRLITSAEYNRKYGVLNKTCNQVNKNLFSCLVGVSLLKTVNIDGLNFLICHGSPDNPFDEYIYPDSEKIDLFYEKYNFDILVLGHTHKPFIHKKNNRFIINPGSCTLPRGKNGHPSVIICDTHEFSLKINYIVQNHHYIRVSKNKVSLL